jgi:hypothetical protein
MRSFYPIVFGYLVSRRASPAEDEPVAAESDRHAERCTAGRGGAFGCSRRLGTKPICGNDAFRTIPPASRIR